MTVSLFELFYPFPQFSELGLQAPEDRKQATQK